MLPHPGHHLEQEHGAPLAPEGTARQLENTSFVRSAATGVREHPEAISYAPKAIVVYADVYLVFDVSLLRGTVSRLLTTTAIEQGSLWHRWFFL